MADTNQLADQFTNYQKNNFAGTTDLNQTWNTFTGYGEFDLSKFNQTLNNQTLNNGTNYPQQNPRNLTESNPPSLLQLTIGQHLINTKDTIFGIFTDLMKQSPVEAVRESNIFGDPNKNIFIKNNRLFYLGLFLIIIFVLYLVLLNLTTCSDVIVSNKNQIGLIYY